MFGNAKPTASLSSGLLARKGQARPAMRSQGFHNSSFNLEDLGWNDMGEEAAPAPAPAPVPVPPPVLVERAVLNEAVRPAAESLPAGRKAAFTLRLDAERHLRLRLASASRNRSSQALVIEALDRLFETLPELDGLARQLDRTTAPEGTR